MNAISTTKSPWKNTVISPVCHIASLVASAATLLAAKRSHWRVPFGRENSLHWVLDIAFHLA
ncbi:MAG: hypothetical protein M3Q45_02105 [Chloroflexota bacterium]|nr:hypothetical protein [Chloroflexota bacterium]